MVARSLRLLVAPALALAGLAVPQPSARAGMVTYSVAVGGSAFGGETYANFDGQMLGSTSQADGGLAVSFANTNGAFVRNSVGGQYAAPILSGGNDTFFATAANPTYTGADVTTYVTTGTGAATLTFAAGSANTYFGLLWGSIDAYNSPKFSFSDGTSETIGGSSLLAALGVGGAGRRRTGTAAVPERSSMTLCGIAGVGGLGYSRLRRRRPIA